MILLFTGTPGSGKTYEAVKKIIDNLRRGRKVYTNIDGMDDPICHEVIKNYLDLDDYQFHTLFHHLGDDRSVIENFWNHCEHGALIVIDEIQKFFSNRDWQTDKNKAFGDWASTHRHQGYDLVMITQNAERVDSAVRALSEWNYVFRKINFFGGAVQKKYLCNSYCGDSTQGTPLAKNVRTYNSKIFNCYKSYVSEDTKELSIMKHVNVLKHPIFFAIPVMLCLCIYMVFFKSSLGKGDLFGVDAIQDKSFSMVGTAEAKINDENIVLPPDVPTSVEDSPLEVLPSAPPVPSKLVKLNNLQVYRKDLPPITKIIFDRIIYTQDEFPYPIVIRNRQLYADIPLSYFAALEDY